MKYFLPDSQDLVDPSFDFDRERRSETRQRQRDDLYAHEVFAEPAFDGILVSKGIVDGYSASTSRYTLAQRHRLLRLGAPEFFRLRSASRTIPLMGDCGAFTYVKEDRPPYSVDELLQFYDGCQFDIGISLDHVIFRFTADDNAPPVEADRLRQELTLELAQEFLSKHKSGRLRFQPVGVAQGWSPRSYAHAVSELQRIGYRYIALGGMVPLKSPEIVKSLEAIADVRAADTQLHLLGVTRTEHLRDFSRLGVASFDSTSPLRQAFKDARDNYYGPGGPYTAIRIPQVDGNPGLQRLISSGEVSQERARFLERACLDAMKDFDTGKLKVADVVGVLIEYEALYDPGKKSHEKVYTETLSAAPWRECGCEVCRDLRYHVILFRGAERNRRRGFHNVWTFYRQLKSELGQQLEDAA